MVEHHQSVVALGNRTLEFFYDAANPTGSTLNVRTDVDYGIGAVNVDSVWEEDDLLFWVGFTASGGVNVYLLENFAPRVISTDSIARFLGSAVNDDSIKMHAAGIQIGGKIYYCLTLYNLVSTVQPTCSLVYEAKNDRWGFWDLEHDGLDHFPLASWTKSNATYNGLGILTNGDLVSINDDNNPQDTVEAQRIFEPGVFEDGVFSNTQASGTNIQCQIVPGPTDMGTRRWKYQAELAPIGTPTTAAQTLTVEVSNEADANWTVSRDLDVSLTDPKLRALGKFKRRNYRFSYSGDEQYEFEGVETVEAIGDK